MASLCIMSPRYSLAILRSRASVTWTESVNEGIPKAFINAIFSPFSVWVLNGKLVYMCV